MEISMDWRLTIAAIITLGIAVTHSMLGEKHIIRRLARMSFDVFPPQRREFIRLTIRLAWHLTSVFMLGCSALLIVLAIRPIELVSIFVLEIIGALFVVCAAITASYSKGRHIAWPLFASVGVLSWWAAVQHEGVSSFDNTKPAIGIAVSLILFLIGAIHFYWAAGGSAGLFAAIPEKDGKPLFRPDRTGTAIISVFLSLAAALVAEQSIGLVQLGLPEVTHIGCILLSLILVVRSVGDFRYLGLFKTVQTTTFGYYDTAAYTPLCLLLAVGVMTVTL